MKIISSQFFAFQLREKVNKYVKLCGVCTIHKVQNATHREDDGEHIATEPSALMVCDIAGPYRGAFASATSGEGKYVFVAVDAFVVFAYCVALLPFCVARFSFFTFAGFTCCSCFAFISFRRKMSP